MCYSCLSLCIYCTDGYVVLESVKFPDHHVGVRESGEVKKPSHTGKGLHGQFTPVVISNIPFNFQGPIA